MPVIGHGYDDNVGAPAFRNVIINGSMSVAQRNTGSVALTTGLSYATVDRWVVAQATSANGISSQITTSLPVGFRTGIKIGRNSTATNTGAIILSQSIETVDSIRLQGKQIVLSFYAKAGSNFSGSNIGVQVWTGTGTDQSAATIGGWTGAAAPIFTTQVITSSWVRYTFVGTVSTSATQIGVYLFYTPSGTAGADDNLYITGVQLEAGSVATPFEFEPFETTLRKCQRYYEKSYNVDVAPGTSTISGYWFQDGATHGDSTMALRVQFAVPKRNNTYNAYFWNTNGTSGTWTYVRSGTSSTAGISMDSKGTSSMLPYISCGVAWTIHMVYGHWAVDAEL